MDGRACRCASSGLALLLTAAPGVAWDCASRLAREVANNVIVSTAGPAGRIRVEEALPYVGALRFDLKGVACVERQVFAAVEKGRIRRLFIVQFESILDASDEVYRWNVRTPVVLGGVPYQHNVFAFDTEAAIREEPEAETAKTGAFLRARGLALDRELVMSRFARVVGADRRRELIFFYMERALASVLTERSLKAFALLPK